MQYHARGQRAGFLAVEEPDSEEVEVGVAIVPAYKIRHFKMYISVVAF
jgi:hypothetical protein